MRLHEQTSKDVDWLVENGVQFGSVNLNAQVYGPDGKRVGAYLVDDMKIYLDEHGIDYRLSTRADHLLTDDSGKVCGIAAVAPNGETYEIQADAVVLATGGYFGNAEMTEQYFPGWGSNPFDCSVGADGSGMLMAEAVGAELAGMDYANFHAIAGYYNGASRSLTMVAGNGGIVTADNTQALTAEGEPIEGLYAAGECTQKKAYMKFNLGAAVYEGREAIRTILAEN